MIFITIYISLLRRSGTVFEKSDKQSYLTKLVKAGTVCTYFLFILVLLSATPIYLEKIQSPLHIFFSVIIKRVVQYSIYYQIRV